jgi:cobalt-zinc-cadmium efflux system protein
MSGHVVIDDMGKAQTVLRAARRVMKEKFGIDHATIQIEDERLRSEEAELRV